MKQPPGKRESTPTRNLRQKVDIFHRRGSHRLSHLFVRSLPLLPARPRCAVLSAGSRSLRCAVGRNGVGVKRIEGDSITPIGHYNIVNWYARFDRKPRFRVGCVMISRSTGWCDDPHSFAYNRIVRLPHPFSAETLWRDDHLYDLVGVINFNFRPRIRGRGSAIFLHFAQNDLAPTAGCVALHTTELYKLKSILSARAQIFIGDRYWRRSPKIADPTLTSVAPIWTANSKSALIPIESSRS